MDPDHRVVVIVILLILTAGLGVHHGATASDEPPRPGGEAVAERPGDFDGETILVFGTVEALTDDAFVIDVHKGHLVTVESPPPAVAVGGVVQVYGEIGNGHTTIDATNMVVVNRSPADQLYKLILSVLGVLVAAGVFLWYWSIDWSNLQFTTKHG